MAHFQFNSNHPDPEKANQVLINGVDFSDHAYADFFELVEVGAFPEVGLQVTFSIEKLTIDGVDVELTNPEAAALLRRATSLPEGAV